MWLQCKRRIHCEPTVAQVTPGERAAGAQPFDGALDDHLAAGGAGTGAEVDDVVGDRDRLRLVLDHEDGVALVAQPQQVVSSGATDGSFSPRTHSASSLICIAQASAMLIFLILE